MDNISNVHGVGQNLGPSNNNALYQQWIDAIEKWETQIENHQPNATGYGEEIAEFLQSCMNKHMSPEDALKAVQAKFFSNASGSHQDPYMRSNTYDPQDLQNLVALFTGTSYTVRLDSPTDMDKLLMSYRQELGETLFTKSDRALLMAFIDEIGRMGSNGKLSDLKAWAKDIMKDPIYTKASANVQNLFKAFTVDYTPSKQY